MKKIFHYLGKLLTTNNFNICSAFTVKKERNFEYIYVSIDIHGTILKPDYGNIAMQYYPNAKETLQNLSKYKYVKMILFTCSYEHEIEKYLEFFKNDGIRFDYVNKNPEAENTRGGYFVDKHYTNVMFEDKAGFVGEYDWIVVDYLFKKYNSKIKKEV